MSDFTFDWFTGSGSPDFLNRVLSKFKGQPDINALEIGSFEGRSAVWFLENILTDLGSSIVCIEPFTGSADLEHVPIDWNEVERKLFSNLMPFHGKFSILAGPSREVLTSWRMPNNGFHFAYIDGSHLAKDVLFDALVAWNLIVKGGVMVFDDYLWGNEDQGNGRPKPGIDAFLSVYSGDFKMLESGYKVAIEKISV